MRPLAKRFTNKMSVLSVTAVSALSLSACAGNYAGEGAAAGAVAGGVIGAVTGDTDDAVKGAAIGAAAGAAAGYFVDKNDRCDGYDRRGRLDEDCRGLRGYPR
ncbi:YMGG-like glycine zipper-containing protein [Parasphingorhabdus sp. JC815]|uniref:glycine zipper 2TM domain-containing protein n=1 Tax=Parasphingorhabdus sp. JC815 TaxID=3232140 RepID=UPI00345A25C6